MSIATWRSALDEPPREFWKPPSSLLPSAAAVRLRRAAAARLPARFAAATADRRHVLAVPAHCHAALAAGFARFAGIEFVRRALGVRRLATLAGDLLLLVAIHRREAAIAPGARSARSALRAVLARAVARGITLPTTVGVLAVLRSSLPGLFGILLLLKFWRFPIVDVQSRARRSGPTPCAPGPPGPILRC